MFLDRFAVLMLKIILKNKKNIILIFSKNTLKNNRYYIYESRKISCCFERNTHLMLAYAYKRVRFVKF